MDRTYFDHINEEDRKRKLDMEWIRKHDEYEELSNRVQMALEAFPEVARKDIETLIDAKIALALWESIIDEIH